MKSKIILLFLFKRVIIKITTTTLIKMSMAHTDGRNMRPCSIMSLTCRVVVVTIGCVFYRGTQLLRTLFLCNFFSLHYSFNYLCRKKVISDKVSQKWIETRFGL